MKALCQNKKLKRYDFHFVQFPTNKLVVLSNYQSYRFTQSAPCNSPLSHQTREVWGLEGWIF